MRTIAHNQECFILALNTGSIAAELELIKAALHITAVRPLVGCYKQVQEHSYLVIAEKEQVLALAAKYNQESVLYLDAARNAFLIYLNKDGSSTPCDYIGQFRSKPEVIAKAQDSWTLDPRTGTYYIVQPTTKEQIEG